MKKEDIDKKIGMPDVDAEWARFEREVIAKDKKPTLRRLAAWAGGIGIAAAIALLFVLNMGSEESADQPLVAQQTEEQSPVAQPSEEQPLVAQVVEEHPLSSRSARSDALLAKNPSPLTPHPSALSPHPSTVYDCGEISARFPGGDKALRAFIDSLFVCPDLAVYYGAKGRVIVTFLVDTLGQTSDFKVVRNGFACDSTLLASMTSETREQLHEQLSEQLSKEATRVLSQMPRWTPAEEAGKIISQKWTVPVIFNGHEEALQRRIAGLTIVPSSSDLGSSDNVMHLAESDASQRSSRIKNKVNDVKLIGSDLIGDLKFLTTYSDGKKLAERLHIQPDSASDSWQEKHRRGAFYNKLRVQLLMPKHVAFGMGSEPSQSREWALYFDSVSHALVYHKADTNIWQASRKALGEYKKVDGKLKWVRRKHPKSCRHLKVRQYSMPITDQQARDLKAMWMDAVNCAKEKKAFLLDGTKCEFPIGKLKAERPGGVNPLITFTDKLAEAIYTHNVSCKDSLLADSTLRRCLTDTKEAVKPWHFNYDSLIMIVNKQQLPDSLCKLIRHRPQQYFHQQGLMVDKMCTWFGYGGKFYSGYDKDCPIIELVTIPDTLSDAYVNQHPYLQQSLRHVTGTVVDENDQPLVDAWVGMTYDAGPGAATDSAGHFSFWLPRSVTKLRVKCVGFQSIIRNIQPTDTTFVFRMKDMTKIREVKVQSKKELKE